MSLAATARRLAPQFAEQVTHDRQLRRLSDASWSLLLDNGLLRALQPARWGGAEVGLLEFIDMVMEVAHASPAAGWVAGVVGVHPWQLGLFDDAAQADMWAGHGTWMHSSSYNPTGRAEPVDGGFRVSGRWSFSSGCDHCQAVNLGAIAGAQDLGGGRMAPDFRSFLLLREQYSIDDNWHVGGLQGTGSKDIVVEDAFVPNYRTQSHLDYALGRPLPGRAVNPSPLYGMPFSVVFNMALAASVLGSARGFIESWIETTGPRRVGPGGATAADDPLVQRRVAEAQWNLDAAVLHLRSDARTLWNVAAAGEHTSERMRAQMRWNMNRGCELVSDSVLDLFRTGTGRALYLEHPLQARFQDVQAALAHSYLLTDPLAKQLGGRLLGTSTPETVM